MGRKMNLLILVFLSLSLAFNVMLLSQNRQLKNVSNITLKQEIANTVNDLRNLASLTEAWVQTGEVYRGHLSLWSELVDSVFSKPLFRHYYGVNNTAQFLNSFYGYTGTLARETDDMGEIIVLNPDQIKIIGDYKIVLDAINKTLEPINASEINLDSDSKYFHRVGTFFNDRFTDHQGRWSVTALYSATYEGNYHGVQLLLSGNAGFYENNILEHALEIATYSNNLAIINLLNKD